MTKRLLQCSVFDCTWFSPTTISILYITIYILNPRTEAINLQARSNPNAAPYTTAMYQGCNSKEKAQSLMRPLRECRESAPAVRLRRWPGCKVHSIALVLVFHFRTEQKDNQHRLMCLQTMIFPPYSGIQRSSCEKPRGATTCCSAPNHRFFQNVACKPDRRQDANGAVCPTDCTVSGVP